MSALRAARIGQEAEWREAGTLTNDRSRAQHLPREGRVGQGPEGGMQRCDPRARLRQGGDIENETAW